MIPESDEVRAERARHFHIPRPSLEPIRDWVDDLDTDQAVKYYLAALLVLLALQTAGSCIAKIVGGTPRTTREGK